MPIALGQTVDDFTFLMADGSQLQLRSLAGKPLLLVFLRHLA
jgi:peroxiredoxin